ncbi:hypothetical protein BB558_007092 [Smittium angustum]|uniref:HotDog ACOT-type domain-containing protein n=1 Tax=Smittium angustum TaxID=133377 RepID=A0A2U1IVY3_SMIAN|nr:hypothetical protein BB558_007092 [Smittium angustum]
MNALFTAIKPTRISRVLPNGFSKSLVGHRIAYFHSHSQKVYLNRSSFLNNDSESLPNENSESHAEMMEWEKALNRYSVLPTKTQGIIDFYKHSKAQIEKQDSILTTQENSSSLVYDQELVLKTIKDSYCELWLPFKDVPSLLEQYISYMDGIRIGKILEDLDRLAGAIAYKHTSDVNENVSNTIIVTAAVDRIDILEPIESDKNYKASGIITYVGFSSMEISLKLEEVLSDVAETEQTPTKKVLVARFTMVALNKDTGRAKQINPLKLETTDERRVFKASERIKQEKVAFNKKGLLKSPPNEEESRVMHSLWSESKKYSDLKHNTKSLPDDFMWMDETLVNSVHVCYPQERNIHYKIFGGFLMRVGHELAYANASTYSSSRCISKSLDDFSFTKPVNIGSILRLTSQVVYSFHDSLPFDSEDSSKGYGNVEIGSSNSNSSPSDKSYRFEVAVKVDVLNPLTQETENTNTFHFTFESEKPVKRVIPRTYGDMIKYIEGRRRAQIGQFISRIQKQTS